MPKTRLPIVLGALACLALSRAADAQGSPLRAADREASPCLWSPLSNAPIDRLEAHAVVVDGRLLVFGGFKNGSLQATARLDIYDPATDTWSVGADMPADVTHGTIAADGDQVWIAGGFLGDHPGPVVDGVWRYDLSQDTWTTGPSLPEPRGSAGMVRLGRTLHFFGGVGVNKNIPRGEHWTLDLDNPVAWVPAPSMPVPRNHMGAVAVDGRAYSVGGQDGHGSSPQDLNALHAYDPALGQWVELANLPFGRSHFEPGTFVQGDRIVIVGGRATPLGRTTLTHVTAYDISQDEWVELAPLPSALIAPVANVVNGQMVVTGGGTGSTVPIDVSIVRPWATTLFDGATRINSGGTSYDAVSGESWCMDQSASSGANVSNLQIADIAGTDDDDLYRYNRSGSNSDTDHFEYHVKVLPGLYRVRLHFAETWWGATGGGSPGVGRRVFNVVLEDDPVLVNFDLYAEVGPMAATVRSFDTAVLDGVVDIIFHASADRPLVAGIELIPLADDAFSRYCISAPNSATAGANIGFRGTTSVGTNNLRIYATALPPNQLGFFMLGSQQTQAPLGDGFLCLAGQVSRFLPPHTSNGNGNVSRLLNLANPTSVPETILAGSTWNFQFFYRDAVAGSFNFTDALQLSFTR